jgi:putative mycofactocin binding protein MftB
VNLLNERLALSPSLALRPEPFGALAYHFGTRRLTFLKRPELLEVMRGLDGDRQLSEVLVACQIPSAQWPVYAQTIERLIDSGMVVTAAEVKGDG